MRFCRFEKKEMKWNIDFLSIPNTPKNTPNHHLITFGMKRMKCETDFCRGKANVASTQTLELAVLFGTFRYQRYIERAFVKWHNRHL